MNVEIRSLALNVVQTALALGKGGRCGASLFGMKNAQTRNEEVIRMQHLVFAIGAGAIVLLAVRAYNRFQRWNRRRRLRGALECLDAVHNALAGLAECKSSDSESTRN